MPPCASVASPAVARLTLLLAVVGLALVVLSAAPAPQRVDAAQLLQNPGFEEWSGSAPTGWSVTGMAAAQSTTALSGFSAALTLSGGAGRLRQPVLASAGASYSGSIAVSAPSSVSVTLRIVFYDALQGELESAHGSAVMTGTFVTLFATATAPGGVESALFLVDISGSAPPGQVFADSASLSESAPPPTATATPTAVPTVTPTPATDVSPSPTGVPPGMDTATPTPGATATATRTAKPTRTATATRTPKSAGATATRTPTARRQPTSTRVPTATRTPGGTATPTPKAGGTEVFGGYLVNGNFEDVAEDRPVGWSKFGGTLGITPDAFRGDYAASLESSTASTKWIYQVVTVEPGSWFAASAMVRLDGTGDAFIRLSWYASDDGNGTALSQEDSGIASSGTWTTISTGGVQAPAEAHSVRVRLTFRPDGVATAFFDDALFVAASASTPTPTSEPAPATAPGIAGPLPTGSGSAPRSLPRTTTPGRSTPGAEAAAFATTLGLRLSEFLSNPEQTGRDSAFEWVEIVNTSAETISLAGWRIGDSRETDPLPATSVPPNAFVVVAAKSAPLPAEVLVVRVADGEVGAGLNNSGDTIRLLAPDGTEADALSFGDDDSVFDPPPTAPGVGKTLASRAPASDPGGANWALALRPTPGEANEFPAAAGPTQKAGAPQSSGVLAAGGAAPAAVNRGEGAGSILWIVAAASAGSLVAGAPLAWRRYRRKSNLGS